MRRLAQALIHRNEARLQPSLQRFLTAVMDGQPTESELQEDYHHLIYQACIVLYQKRRYWHKGCSGIYQDEAWRQVWTRNMGTLNTRCCV